MIVVYIVDLLDEFYGVVMFVWMWMKGCFGFDGIFLQYQYVVNVQELKVDEGIFCFFFGKFVVNQVWNGIYLVFVYDCCINFYCIWLFLDRDFFEQVVFVFFVNVFFMVVSNIDKVWFEFYQWIDVVVDGFDICFFQRWQNFKGKKCVFCLL